MLHTTKQRKVYVTGMLRLVKFRVQNAMDAGASRIVGIIELKKKRDNFRFIKNLALPRLNFFTPH